MNNMMNFAMKIIQSNPQIAQNPQAKEFLNVIQSGDEARGSEIANNLCNTYGMSKDEALQNAKKFFNL